MEILKHDTNRNDIECVRPGLRFIAKFDNPLRDLEFSDFDGGNLGCGLLGLLRLTVRRQELRQIHAPVFKYRSEEHTSELQSLRHLVCRLLLEKKKQKKEK